MKIVVTFAVDWELKPWRGLRAFKPEPGGDRVLRAQNAGNEITVILTGVGPLNAIRTLQDCLNNPPDVCIASGLAGGLRREHRCGDILAARTVCRETDSDSLASDQDLYNEAIACGAKPAASFVSVAKVAGTTKRKSELGVLADAVDMESFAILEEMHRRSVPCVAIRSIADEIDLEFGCNFGRALDDSGRIRMTALFGQVARAPQQLWPLLRLGIASWRAATALAHYLDSYINCLGKGKASLGYCPQPATK